MSHLISKNDCYFINVDNLEIGMRKETMFVFPKLQHPIQSINLCENKMINLKDDVGITILETIKKTAFGDFSMY